MGPITVSLVLLLQDSQQNSLLGYFKESFIEEEIIGDSEVTSAVTETKPSSRSQSGK